MIHVAAVCSVLFAVTPAAPAPVTIVIDRQRPAAPISDDFLGLSFESELLLPDASGQRFFRGSNAPLVAAFKALGIRSLRIGGNTADRPSVAVPGPADVDSLFAFADAADVRVIYTLRLRANGPQEALPIARHIVDHHRSRLLCFAIGNEPNVYAKQFAAYQAELQQYMDALAAAHVEARFCGPSTTPAKVAWAEQLGEALGKSGRLALLTQHAYPGGSARKVTDPAAARDTLLSPRQLEDNQKFFAALGPAAAKAQLPYRLEEANSFYNGGALDVSDTFASALWGLDFLHWWAAHGAAGINFHTGETVAAGEQSTPCHYAVFLSAPGGYVVHPLGYAMKAFALGGRGRSLPVTLVNTAALNLTAYATLDGDGSVLLTVINKEHGAAARAADVRVDGWPAKARSEVLLLEAPHAEVAAKTGITLGGAVIDERSRWRGGWRALASSSAGVLLQVPPATAAVLRLRR